MTKVKFFSGENIPLEMHKVRIVQKLNLPPVEQRLEAIQQAGCNTFLLQNRDVFMDMLTDSGVNAMSDNQLAAMMVADDAYAGSETFNRLHAKLKEIFGMEFFLPTHQGRAAEHIIAKTFVKPGDVVAMNFHFTTTKAHITQCGGRVEELVSDEGINTTSDCLFKGNMDLNKLKASIERNKGHMAFLRLEAGTNLIGGQPFSLENCRAATKLARDNGKEPKDAYYTVDPHVVYPSENGLDFNISLEEAKNLLNSSETECTIPLKVLTPNVTTNMIGVEAFPDLLATFSTKYATSNTNRTTNLRLAADKINGYVLLPNETFSYNTVVGKRTIAAGYKEAAVYENGEVVQGLGGGICQISTTLFNSVLLANLEIVELHNHQFIPSYVSAGRDATVVYGTKDFQFKNNRQHALKITCSVSRGIATFNIYGVKEENEYEVSVYAKVNSKTSKYIKSSTYRTIKSNGTIINNELIANFTYKTH
ncbi:MAG: VanW family protein [Clostridia bacterium]|nr:VanW family protein [Clostridia bacterium]